MAGRKPMKVVATTVRLPAGVAARIDTAAGKTGARSDYIRKAVDAALAKQARTEKAKSKPKRATDVKAKTKAKPKNAAPKKSATPAKRKARPSARKRPASTKLTRARAKPSTVAKMIFTKG